MPDIIINQAVKKYEATRAVDGVSLTIPEGEFCVIVGPSGSGKTTLLNLIAGFVQVDEGSICIGDINVSKIPPRDRKIGMIFQDIGLFSHMNVRENLSYGLKIAKVDKAEIARRVDDIAAKMRITHLLNKNTRMISGGEAQRVAIGRALIMDPAVCLFDEPLGNLDANLRVELLEEIRRLHRDMGKTFVLITHDQEQAMSAGTLVVVMKNGKLMQADHPQRIYQNPQNKFVAEFFGVSSMNMISGEIAATGNGVFHGEGIHLAHAGLAVHAGKQVYLGIRPCHIHLDTVASDRNNGTATVSMIERLGDRNLVYCQLDGEQRICAAMPPDAVFEAGQAVFVSFQPGCAFVFDGKQGDRIL